MSKQGFGEPVQVIKDCKITGVDTQKAMLQFEDGTYTSGDVVVGADGVHSVTRQCIQQKAMAFQSQQSAFRFLVTKQAALANPVTSAFLQGTGSLDMWHGKDRKVVMYPCADNSLLNFVCVHPGSLSKTTDIYNTAASKHQLIEIYKGFDHVVMEFFALADPDTIKVYPLFDMDPLPTFTKDKLVLLGDAAHPFTPHLGQGGAMAMEDAVSLGVMLSRNLPPEKIHERLELYNIARYKRATRLQAFSRALGEDSQTGDNVKPKLSLVQCLDECMSHDEYHHSTHILRQLELNQTP